VPRDAAIIPLAQSVIVLVIVGAAIVNDGRVLAAQRAEPPELAGGWEFPGGKVDPGESDLAALERECREELGVDIEVDARLGSDVVLPSGTAVLRIWTARLTDGDPVPLEHTQLRWLAGSELHTVDWLPADLPFVAELRRLLPGA
jgi:8-oxo-dGTP diphosphatase